jgi:hypothetical protein
VAELVSTAAEQVELAVVVLDVIKAFRVRRLVQLIAAVAVVDLILAMDFQLEMVDLELLF